MSAATLRDVPRAPGRAPAVGHLWPLWRRPTAFLRALATMGDIVRVDLGRWPVYFVTRPDLIHQVLVTDGRRFHKGRIHDLARPLLGDGLVTSDGTLHRRQRRLIQPAFHRARIASYAEVMEFHARALAQSWRAGQTVAVDAAMRHLTLTVAAQTMLSAASDGRWAADVHRCLPIVAQDLFTRAIMPSVVNRLPIPVNRRFDDAAARLRQVIDEVIEDHNARADSGGDLLSMLMTARDAETGETMGDVQLRDELVSVLMGGTETTATTLSWTFHELSRRPDVADQLQAEVDRVVGQRPVGPADVPALKLVDRVLNEVVRRHPPLLLMRRVTGPVQLAGIDLPVGTEIAFSPDAVHHDPRWYPDPQRFDPDRWLPSRSPLPQGAYVPFGDGSRKCIGDAFAWTEMSITLATIVARWRLVAAPGHTPREVTSVIPRPDSLPMIVTATSLR